MPASDRVDVDDLLSVVRTIPADRSSELARKIREFLVDRVCRTGGHLGSNLGAVELTIAVHRVFDSPRDAICFDTGHQAYVHKILTGRAAAFAALRQRGGLSGYPSRDESVHDLIENSHASTALSYADGLARAFAMNGQERHVVAVVGDGALTGGMCWEALNNIAAAGHARLVIVLNDNGRSYAPTVGGVAEHLAAVRGHTSRHSTLFGDLGLAYVGPVDGHDIAAVESALRQARDLAGPVVVHCVTVKGQGYLPAEADQADHLHGVGVVDPATGKPVTAAKPTMTSVFAEEICVIGAERPDVVCLTAAMPGPTGLAAFGERFPGRLIDVGIAEQHAVCSAAGLAMGGLHPVVALYATFLNRAYDQLLMDVALHRLGVTFVLDRAGITGPDGPSHHGVWDTAILATVPGLRLAAPRDPGQLRELLREAVATRDAPTAVRFAKATAGPDINTVARRMDGMDILFRGRRKALDVLGVAIGTTAAAWLEAAADLDAMGIGVTVVDPRWAIPVNPSLVHLAARHRLVVTAEDCGRTGGAGALLAQACTDAGIGVPVRNVGIPRAFVGHGTRDELLNEVGLSAAGITTVVRDLAARLGIRPVVALGIES